MKKREVIFVIVIVVMLAAIYVTVTNQEKKSVTTLERPDTTEQEANYKLGIIYDGVKTSIEVSLNMKQLTVVELDELFAGAFEQLKKDMIGENTSLEEINQDLNLVMDLSGYGMKVDWYIEDTELVNYWGNVSSVEEATEMELTAIIRYTGATVFEEDIIVREYSIPIVLIPKQAQTKTLEENIEDIIHVADEEYRYEDKVYLPKELNGKEILFVMAESSDTWIYMVLILIVIVCLFCKTYSDKEENRKKRNELLLQDYPELVMKLSLLIGAGMTPYNAFCKIGNDYNQISASKKRPGYEEVLYMINRIKTGVHEVDAYIEFGRRAGLACYIKLSTLLQQNIVKGNENLRQTLSQELSEAMENRKARARMAGEQAGTKLMLPMFMMLGIVFVVIMVPAFMSF